MKQIDEIPCQNLNRLFETPQKKQRPAVMLYENKANDAMSLLEIEEKHKFDLGSSPRFIGSKEIDPHGKSSVKHQSASQSLKKNNSPVLIKIEENDQSDTPYKYFQQRRKRMFFEEKYGDLSKEQNLMKCYDDLMNDIKNGQTDIMIPTPQIFSPYYQEDYVCSQLVTFNLNPKNSRKLVYDQDKNTVVPIFECLGCKIVFNNPSALGGHLSRCPTKELHYEKLNDYYQSCQIIEEECEEQQVKEKKEFNSDRKSDKIKDTPKKHKIFKEHEKESPCFFSSSESKSLSKSIAGQQKHYFDHSMQPESLSNIEDSMSSKSEKTLKKISRKAFIPNKSRGKNKRIFKFTK